MAQRPLNAPYGITVGSNLLANTSIFANGRVQSDDFTFTDGTNILGNLSLVGNTISADNTGDNIVLQPNGTGNVYIGGPGQNNPLVVTGNIFAGNVVANALVASNGSNIYITGNLLPSANLTYTLGSPDAKFANIWIGPNTINIQDTANSSVNARLTVTNGVLLIDGVNQIQAPGITNGNSNISIAANGNINMSVRSTANVLTLTTDGATVQGNVSANYYIGNGALLTGLPPALQTYIFANANSNISTYYQAVAIQDFVAGTLKTVTVSVGTSETLLAAFATNSGFPAIINIPVGTFSLTYETQRTSGNPGTSYYTYARIYKRNLAGTETLLITTDQTSITTLQTLIQQTVVAYNSSLINLLTTDRIVTKIYAVASSSTTNILLQWDDTTDGAINLPVPTPSVATFVPYTGAVNNVDLGSYSLTTTGNVSGGNLLSTGSVFVNSKKAVNGPAFSAYANSTLQTITSGSQQKVLFQTEEFDTDNCFANSRFTPTVEGYYQLNSEVRLDGASGTGEMMIVIWKNGAEYKRGTNQSGVQIASDFWAMTVSSLVYANGTTDYFEIYVQQGSGGSVTVTAVNAVNITWFNGVMVRGA